MITTYSTFLFNFLSQFQYLVNIPEPLILFGLYYGFLTTLPISFSHIVVIRNRLIEGKTSSVMAFCGLITGQLCMIGTIYYTPLYKLFIKPHLILLLSIIYSFFYWQRLRNNQNYDDLREAQSLINVRNFFSFFDSFVFQILNPILLPTPIFFRLNNVFLFRYSNNLNFFLSFFIGSLIGNFLFFNALNWIRYRFEQDSNVIYPVLKLLINKSIIPIVFCICLIPIAKYSHIPFCTMKQKEGQSSYSFDKNWPNIIFDSNQPHRPIRIFSETKTDDNDNLNINDNLSKKQTSQFFFKECISDGNVRISYTYPSTLANFQTDLFSSFQDFSLSEQSFDNLYSNWKLEKLSRKDNLNNLLLTKIKLLNNKKEWFYKHFQNKFGTFIKDDNNYNKFVKKSNDVRLKQSSKIQIKKSKLLTSDIRDISTTQSGFYDLKKNKLKSFISQKFKMNSNNSTLPVWNHLNKQLLQNELKRIKKQLQDKTKNIKENDFNNLKLLKSNIETIDNTINDIHHNKIKQITSVDLIKIFATNNKTLLLETLAFNKKITQKDNFNFNKLFQHKNKKFTTNSGNENTYLNLNDIFKNIKRLPKWRTFSKHVVYDEVSDIRRRAIKSNSKLKIANKDSDIIIFEYKKSLNFRARLPKGSLRARRKNKFTWKFFHNNLNSPFFIRSKQLLNKTDIPFLKYNENYLNFFKNFISPDKNINYLNNDISEMRRQELLFKWDKTNVHILRSMVLVGQAFFRKYIKLPIFIFLKNLSRQLLYQPSEWTKDWSNWMNEWYIFCYYDGTELAKDQWPEMWLQRGIQIKLINPFYIKPWYIQKSFIKNKQDKKTRTSYLTVFGSQQELPFGKKIRMPSFWKPVRREVSKSIKLKLYFPFLTLQKNTILLFEKVFNKKTINEDNKTIEKSILNKKNEQLILKKDEVIPNNKSIAGKLSKLDFHNQNITKTSIKNATKQILIKNEYNSLLKENKNLFTKNKIVFLKIKNILNKLNLKLIKVKINFTYKIKTVLKIISRNLLKFYSIIQFQLENLGRNNSNDLSYKNQLSYQKDFPNFNNFCLNQANIIQNLCKNNILKHKKLNQNFQINSKNLNQTNIIDVNPENIEAQDFKNLLENIYTFTPTINLWDKLSTNNWKISVQNNWKQKSYNNYDLTKKALVSKNLNFISYFYQNNLINNLNKKIKHTKIFNLSKNYLSLNNLNQNQIKNFDFQNSLNNNITYKKNIKNFTIRQNVPSQLRRWDWKNNKIKKFVNRLLQKNTILLKEEVFNLIPFFDRFTIQNPMIRNWSHPISSILDDEIFTYELLDTFLQINKNIDFLHTKQIEDNLSSNSNQAIASLPLSSTTAENFLYYLTTVEDLISIEDKKELKILNSLNFNKSTPNYIKTNVVEKSLNENLSKNLQSILSKETLDSITNTQILKKFLWASYRCEDLACMNRFWFSTNNGSRFGTLRLRLYPNLKN